MITQNFPSHGGNVYRPSAQGAAAGSGSSSQASGSTPPKRPVTGTTFTIRKSAITKQKGK
jgi:hypothetical protein